MFIFLGVEVPIKIRKYIIKMVFYFRICKAHTVSPIFLRAKGLKVVVMAGKNQPSQPYPSFTKVFNSSCPSNNANYILHTLQRMEFKILVVRWSEWLACACVCVWDQGIMIDPDF